MATFSGDNLANLQIGTALNDTFLGHGGNDTQFGGDGKDAMLGQDGDDEINGEAGNDRLRGGDGNDTLNGGADNDDLIGGDGADVMDGGTGIDVVDYSFESSGIIVSLQNPLISGGAALGDELYNIENLRATGFDDKIGGSSADNYFWLYEGNDTVYAFAGNDTIDAGDGDDRIYGGDGDDVLMGGDGNDQIFGGDGADRHIGGAGVDTLRLDDANHGNLLVDLADARLNQGAAVVGDRYNSIENIRMGIGDDTVYGDAGGNDIYGHGGNDEIHGRDGADSLNGYVGADTLYGDDGDDSIFGGAGNDFLDGGAQNDTLDGGKGWDHLTGGAGADVFVFDQLNNNRDTLTDFSVADGDKVDVSAYGFADAAAFTAGTVVEDILDGANAKTGVVVIFDAAQTQRLIFDDAAYVLDTTDFIF